MTAIAPTSYSIPQRALHWLTVVLVFFNLLLPGSIEYVTDLYREGKVPAADDLLSANLHLITGFAILALTLVRLVLRFWQGAPAAPAVEPPALRMLSKIAHGAFYLLLIAMPMAGVGKYFFGNDTAGFVHGGPMKLALWLLIGLHVAGVLVHQFWWKTNVLARMTRG